MAFYQTLMLTITPMTLKHAEIWQIDLENLTKAVLTHCQVKQISSYKSYLKCPTMNNMTLRSHKKYLKKKSTIIVEQHFDLDRLDWTIE